MRDTKAECTECRKALGQSHHYQCSRRWGMGGVQVFEAQKAPRREFGKAWPKGDDDA